MIEDPLIKLVGFFVGGMIVMFLVMYIDPYLRAV